MEEQQEFQKVVGEYVVTTQKGKKEQQTLQLRALGIYCSAILYYKHLYDEMHLFFSK